MRDLVIFGAGGVGRVTQQIVCDINSAQPTWNLVGFLDGDRHRHGTEVDGLEVLGGTDWLEGRPQTEVYVAIGTPAVRRTATEEIAAVGHTRFATIVHPMAWVSDRVEVGTNTLVYPGVLIDVGVTIGSHVILNKASTVGHDTVISNYVTVAPGVNIGGATRIGEGCDLGIGSRLIQGVTVGEWSILGAGAVVINDVPANCTAVGVPARVIKQHER